ncbi:MAG: DUF2939 domain-containing protein [Novosphingobium sp.]|nr:DUF2939 domain-containing protein [Novosphingobium sp.]
MFQGTLKVVVLGLVIIGGLAWYLVSPTYSLSQLREAALDGDMSEVRERVDFQAMRESLKSELRAKLESDMATSGKGKDVFAAAGSAIVMSMVDPMVDALATPQGIERLMAVSKIEFGWNEVPPGEPKPLKWSIERDGFNRVLASPSREGEDGSMALVFERDGFGWKLVGVDLDGEESEE